MFLSPPPYPVGVSVISHNLKEIDQVIVQGRVTRIEELKQEDGASQFEVDLA